MRADSTPDGDSIAGRLSDLGYSEGRYEYCSAAPQDDLFEYSNGTWLREVPIPPEPIWVWA